MAKSYARELLPDDLFMLPDRRGVWAIRCVGDGTSPYNLAGLNPDLQILIVHWALLVGIHDELDNDPLVEWDELCYRRAGTGFIITVWVQYRRDRWPS